MECPKCGGDMEFEEAKKEHGTWYCEDEDCGFEASGSKICCDAEYTTDSAMPTCCDWDEQFDQPNGGYIPYDSDTAGCDKYHQMKDDGEL